MHSVRRTRLRHPKSHRPAFTLTELTAGLAVSLFGLSAAAVSLGGHAAQPDDPAANAEAIKAKDADQLRDIRQAFAIWAGSNQDRYPLPSLIDTDDRTVRDRGSEKNTTANIDSILVYNAFFKAELLVSPAEVNTNIVADKDYQLEEPTHAIDPVRAFWDPALAADFTAGESNISYAHLQPSGGRADRFGPTSKGAAPILGNRGPQIASAAQQDDHSVVATLANPKSNTLSTYSNGAAWSGHLAYDDGSVRFHENMLTADGAYTGGRRYIGAQAKEWPDLWCYDESDDPDSTNDYLGLFIRAGERPESYKAIWD